ncbi:CorA family divalent cation transporter [Streptomyces sp. NPDC079141]
MLPGTSSSAAVLDSAPRELTRILLLFSLGCRIRPEGAALGGLVDRFEFGRFRPHLKSGEAVLPVPVLAERIAPDRLRLPHGDHGLTLASCELLVVATPRGDATLLLDCGFAGATDAASVAAWLATTCFERDQLRLDDRPLLEVVGGRLALSEPLSFGLNVHQLVFPGGSLREELLDHSDETRQSVLLNGIIYRGKMPSEGADRLTVSVPPNLRNHGVTLSAHGRGVSVQAGWAPHVENGLVVVALGMVSALAVLQRTRLVAFAMMKENEQALTTSPSEIRTLISRLSDGVNELQLDLAFGVEAYVDSLLIPEMLMEGFQSSLRDSLGIRDSLDNSARMVERLTSVINARSAALDAALAERDERQNRIVSALVAAATLIALPPTLLLAFFGVNATNVDEGRSILDLGRYGAAYALAWLPFVVLVVIGYFLLRRAGRGSGSLLTPSDGGPAPVPAPRTPSGS